GCPTIRNAILRGGANGRRKNGAGNRTGGESRCRDCKCRRISSVSRFGCFERQTWRGNTAPCAPSSPGTNLVIRDNVGGKISRAGLRRLSRSSSAQEKRDRCRWKRTLSEGDYSWIRSSSN